MLRRIIDFAPGDKPSRPPEPDRQNEILGLSPSGFHRIAYVDWGPIDDKRPVICVHGLTRQGRDFDYLAAELVAAGRRVICPDLPGRGRSGRIRNPRDYSLAQYCSDMNALIARLDVQEVDWVGTSLGGLIGMVMAGFTGSIVRRLVINDIGPFVSSAGLRRIGNYLGEMPTSFATLSEVEQYFRTVLSPYGSLPDEHWRHLASHSVLRNEKSGRYDMLCDPMIAKAFTTPWFYSSIDLWKYWEAIDAPILVLHGGKSDRLSKDLTFEMTRRNPMATLIRFDDHGHVPPLMNCEKVKVVADFLQSPVDGREDKIDRE